MNEFDTSLTGRRALVTGGGSGIGEAIAKTMRAAGAEVRTCDIDPNSGADHICDVGDEDAVGELFTRLDDDLGGLDICVNNVGVAGPTGPVEDMDPDEFDRCVQINLGGTFRVTREAVRRMRAAGRGSIVNISSTAGHFGYPLRSPYSASKWAVEGLTHSWAMELGRHRIRVNCVAPGLVRTPMTERLTKNQASLDASTAMHALGRIGEPQDVAETLRWVLSPEQHWITGQVLGVDGGLATVRAR